MSIPAQNQQYENFIIRYKQNIEGVPEYQPDERFQIINDLFGVCTDTGNPGTGIKQLFLFVYSKMLYIYGYWCAERDRGDKTSWASISEA